jgi:hypothetical protein
MWVDFSPKTVSPSLDCKADVVVIGWKWFSVSCHLEKNGGLRVRRCELKPQIFHSLSESVWPNHFSNLSLNFLIWKNFLLESDDFTYKKGFLLTEGYCLNIRDATDCGILGISQ